MLEMLTLITLATLFIIMFRPGKTPPLDNPLVIQRPGRYHMTLAPQINLAQPFIEDIAKQLGDPDALSANSNTLCFEVRDKEVRAHGKDFYLLAITRRNGMLYFQAMATEVVEAERRADAINAYADRVLADIAATSNADTALDMRIASAVQAAAQQRGITFNRI